MQNKFGACFGDKPSCNTCFLGGAYFRNSPTSQRPSRKGLPVTSEFMFTKQDMAERWLRDLKDTYCDVQPDTNQYHLPFGMRCDVYDLYLRWEI